MSAIEVFPYQDLGVRVASIDGEPWFVTVDLLAVLDLNRSSVALLDDDEKGVHTVDTPGGMQQVSVISEPGLYSLILRSRKPDAKQFKRWVIHEVIPAIRKHGGYLTPDAVEAALLNPDTLINLATQLKAERAAREAAEAEALERRAQMRVLAPKASAFDLWLSSNINYSVDAAAKALCAAGAITGRNRLHKQLGELGWDYKTTEGWRPMQAHGPEGTKRLAVKLSGYQDSHTGEQHATTTLRVTAKGIADLAKALGGDPHVAAVALESAA